MSTHSSAIVSCGQSEPLTRRLKRLLDEYSDGLAVPKELIQNADDAGATSVTLIHDCRQNLQWRDSVMDPMLAECQGPCLWAQNDAAFTEEDFNNIKELGGATKRQTVAKVGKFGLGFNSVYNVTDAPCLLSKRRLLLLDPHGQRSGQGFLEAIHRDIGRDTGVMVHFEKDSSLLQRWQHQFAPYRGICGCDEELNCEGALFRLPLRTADQARRSKIRDRCYSEADVQQLLLQLREEAETLLLFTQSVQQLTVKVIRDGRQPEEAELMFSVGRSLLQQLRRHSLPDAAPTAMLRAAEAFMQINEQQQQQQHDLECAVLLRVQFQNNSTSSSSRTWLLCQRIGSGESLQMSLQHRQRGLSPVGGVAVELRCSGSTNHVIAAQPITDSHLFCFLPLPVQNPLPVLLNAGFELDSSRRHLSQRLVDERQDQWSPGDWNAALLRDAVCAAYVLALQLLASDELKLDNPSSLLQLWPSHSAAVAAPALQPLMQQFYRSILSESGPSLLLTVSDSQWRSLSRSQILDRRLTDNQRLRQEVLQLAVAIADCRGGAAAAAVVELSEEAESCARCVDAWTQEAERRLLSAEEFMLQLLQQLPSVWPRHQEACSRLLLRSLQLQARNDLEASDPEAWLATASVQKAMKSARCVPDAADQLRCPDELLDPGCSAARLFNENDLRVPRRDFCESQLKSVLIRLGLQVEIDFQEFKELVSRVGGSGQTRQQVQQLQGLMSYAQLRFDDFQHSLIQLKDITFLPAVGNQRRNFAPSVLYSYSCEQLVRLLHPVLDEQAAMQSVSYYRRQQLPAAIGVRQQVDWQLALRHLQLVISSSSMQHVDKQQLCLAAYAHLARLLQDSSDTRELRNGLKQVQHKPLLYSPAGFLRPEQVSLDVAERTGCSPELMPLPDYGFKSEFKEFLQAVGVVASFTATSFIAANQRLHAAWGGRPIDRETRSCCLQLLQRLAHLDLEESCDPAQIWAPDERAVLRRCSDISYRGAGDEYHAASGLSFCHSDMSEHLCRRLRIPSARDQLVKNCSSSLPFGQYEKLTTRLRNILDGYPFGCELFKELIQNADDAAATTLHFIIDRRQHPDRHVFNENWKELQGPALLVVNDSVFSDADIKGIQQLGEGSKREDAMKTGRYGIGFNCVYNLTDVPAFLTDNSKLCVMDPLMQYVPGACTASPGRMFNDINDLAKNFGDVLNAFDAGELQRSGSTVFRLPLRTQQQRDHAAISDRVPTADCLLKWFQEFKAELQESLLFLNCLNSVKLLQFTENGELQPVYSAESCTNPKDARSKMQTKCRDASHCLSQSQCSIDRISSCASAYEMQISDSDGVQQQWLVSQQLGIQQQQQQQQQQQLGSALQDLVRRGKWRALPKVGVAARQQGKQISSSQSQSRVYCMLPLPLTTKLPVHVNGHFVLDPSRRSMWQVHAGSDAQQEWNELLVLQLLPQCYSLLLQFVQSRVDGKSVASYFGLLPRAQAPQKSDDLWARLSVSFFKEAFVNKWPLFPTLQESSSRIVWLPLATEADCKQSDAVYMVPADHAANWNLRKVLEQLDFPIVMSDAVALLHSLTSSIRNNETQKMEFVLTPRQVIRFLKGHAELNRRVQNPHPIQQTPLQDVGSVVELLKFIVNRNQLSREKEVNKATLEAVSLLKGSPLNVTADNKLRYFSNSLAYISEFADIFPQACSEFAHEKVEKFWRIEDESTFTLHHQIPDLTKSAVEAGLYDSFDLEQFSRLMQQHFRASICSHAEVWKPVSCISDSLREGVEMNAWLHKVWQFLQRQSAEAVIDAVGQFALLPACSRWRLSSRNDCIVAYEADCLFSIRSGASLLSCNSRATTAAMQELLQTLHQLQAPVSVSVDVSFSGPSLIDQICANFNKLPTLLPVMRYALQQRTANAQQAKVICKILQENWDIFARSEKSLPQFVRNLPIFQLCDSSIGSLRSNTKIGTVPNAVCYEEMQLWHSVHNWQLLQPDPELQKLHKKIDCKILNEFEVYQIFVLPAFDAFSARTKQLHLNVMKQMSLQLPSLQHSDPKLYSSFSNALQSARIIPLRDGQSWDKAANCFDPRIEIFKEFAAADQLLPDQFKGHQWQPLLQAAGIAQSCSVKQLLQFAHDLAGTAATSSGITESLQRKSDKLLQLICKGKGLDELKPDDLTQLSCIEFVVSRIDDELLQLCPATSPQMTSLADAVCHPSRMLCWTVQPVCAAFLHQDKANWKLAELVATQPTQQQLLQHLQNLLSCHTFTSANMQQQEQLQLRAAVLHQFYELLTDWIVSKNNPELLQQLQHLPLVLVAEGTRLAEPSRVTLNSGDLDLSPHLFPLPEKLLQFQPLLLRLGCSERPTMQQLAEVTVRLHKLRLGQQLQLPELQLASSCYELMSQLQQQQLPECICLPTVSSNADPSDTCQMSLLSNTVADDAPSLRQRLHGAALPQLRLLSFVACGVAQDAARRMQHLLLNQLNVKRLSSIVQEVILEEDSECGAECPDGVEGRDCSATSAVRASLQRDELVDAVTDILLVDNADAGIDTTQRQVQQLLQHSAVTCRHKLRTVLLIDGEVVQQSEQEQHFFIREEEGEEEKKWQLLVSHSSQPESADKQLMWWRFLSVKVSWLLQRSFCVTQTGETALLLLLQMRDAAMIDSLMRDMSIIRFSGRDRDAERLRLGKALPDLEGWRLVQVARELRVGELVAYQLPEGHRVLAKVVRAVGDASEEIWSRQYDIDVGEDELLRVPAALLFAFADNVEEQLAVDFESCEMLMRQAAELPEQLRAVAQQRVLQHCNPNRFRQLDQDVEAAAASTFDRVRDLAGIPDEEVDDLFDEQAAMCNVQMRLQAAEMRQGGGGGGGGGGTRVPSGRFGGGFMGGGGGGGRWGGGGGGGGEMRQQASPLDAQRLLWTARADSIAAAATAHSGNYNWAAYCSHQAAEKAVKAVTMHQGSSVLFSHQLYRLVRDVADRSVQQQLLDCACSLAEVIRFDPRYPGRAFSPRIPSEVFSKQQAVAAVRAANEAVRVVMRVMERDLEAKQM